MDRTQLDPAQARSRYRSTPMATFDAGDRAVKWRMPRILPLPEDVPRTGRSAAVRAGERLDQLSSRVLGDPLATWLLLDANSSLDPLRFVEDHAGGVDVPAARVPR